MNRRQFMSFSVLGGAAALFHLPGTAAASPPQDTPRMYNAKNYQELIGTQGFSETLLKNHFALYQGYVNNANKLADLLGRLLKEGKTASPEYAELKRRFGWEFNGMRLHEYYFENLGGQGGIDPGGRLFKSVVQNFGSYQEWEKDFKAVGSLRGIGWAILYQDGVSGKLFNCWINEHDIGHLAGCTPLLILDVFEHAYITDYGLKRADYIAAFMKTVNWQIVEKRIA